VLPADTEQWLVRSCVAASLANLWQEMLWFHWPPMRISIGDWRCATRTRTRWLASSLASIQRMRGSLTPTRSSSWAGMTRSPRPPRPR
jgi:hypothetical protein